MPSESATVTGIRASLTPEQLSQIRDDADIEPGAGQWSHTDMLLAALHDAVMHLAWLTETVNSEKRPEHPKPMPRPGVGGQPARPVATHAQVTYLQAIRDRHNAEAERS